MTPQSPRQTTPRTVLIAITAALALGLGGSWSCDLGPSNDENDPTTFKCGSKTCERGEEFCESQLREGPRTAERYYSCRDLGACSIPYHSRDAGAHDAARGDADGDGSDTSDAAIEGADTIADDASEMDVGEADTGGGGGTPDAGQFKCTCLVNTVCPHGGAATYSTSCTKKGPGAWKVSAHCPGA